MLNESTKARESPGPSCLLLCLTYFLGRLQSRDRWQSQYLVIGHAQEFEEALHCFGTLRSAPPVLTGGHEGPISVHHIGIISLPAKKGLRGSIFMAFHTDFFGLLIRYCPDMGLVALVAFHARVLDMGLVFADCHDIFMAREAVAPVRP